MLAGASFAVFLTTKNTKNTKREEGVLASQFFCFWKTTLHFIFHLLLPAN